MTKKIIPTRRRQAILDFLNEGGEATAAQIAVGVRLQKRTIHNYLKDMRADQEIRTEERQVGRIVTYVHTALVTKTTFIPPPPPPKANKEPWRTVHMGSDRMHPIPNQGGQGALRRTVFVGANTVYK
jgi:hypothetical protein